VFVKAIVRTCHGRRGRRAAGRRAAGPPERGCRGL